MAITVDNRLNGPEDANVTDTTLSDSAVTGTVTYAETGSGPPGEATYQDTQLVHGLNSINIQTDYDRNQTGRLQVSLPAPTWTVRFYMRVPSLRAAGNGTNEVRWVAGLGDYGVLIAEQSNNNILVYLENTSLAQTRHSYDTASGSWFPLDRLIRVEITYDGSNVTVTLFSDHDTAQEVALTWTGFTLNASVAEVTGFRYRDGVLLQPGDNDANLSGTPVEDRQNQLLDWNPDALPQFGADGDYGSETTEWVENFQTEHSLFVDGEIGPETGAAMDLAQQVANGTAQPPPMQVSHLAVSDTSSVGPAAAPSSDAPAAATVSTVVAGQKDFADTANGGVLASGTTAATTDRSSDVQTTVTASAQASGQKNPQVSVSAAATVSRASAGTKEALAQPTGGVLADGTAQGEDTTGGIANTTLAASSSLSTRADRQDGPHGVVAADSTLATAKNAEGNGSAGVSVSTNVDTAIERSGTASAAASASTAAGGTKESLIAPVGTATVSGQASGTSHPTGTADATARSATGAHGTAGFQGSASGGVRAGATATGTKTVTGASASATITAQGQVQGTSETVLPQIPIMGLLYRFIAYEPNGDRRGQLPMPLSFQLGVPFNDLPSLAFEYVRDAPGADLLETPAEVAVEFSPLGSDNYQEYPGCRFLCLRSQSDYTDRAGVRRYTMPNYAWQLRKVRMLDGAGVDHVREFSAATPGEILHTFLTETQDRSNVPGLIWDFTPEADSDGNAWAHTLNVEYDLGQDLWSILQAMSQDGLIDWRTDRRTLQVYNKDTFLDRDRTSAVILHAGRDVTEAPDDSSYEDLASYVMAKGVEGVYYAENNPSAIAPWGKWQDVITQSGVSDHGTLATAVQARLSQTSNVRTQMTRALVFPTTLYLPFRDYRPGDTVLLPGHRGEPGTEGRVRQITIKSVDPHSVEGNLVVNDRFIERDLRMDRKLSALTGNTSSVGGSGGSPGEDTRTPAAPTGLVLSTDAYINENGTARGQISAGWTAVDTAENGTDMTVDSYEVWLRHAVSGAQWQQHTTVDDPDTTADMSPFDVGEIYEVAVRAVGRNNRRSDFSGVETITVVDDAIAPPVPSDPVLSTRLGVIRAYWDGLTETGTDMPLDFAYTAVYMSETGAGGTFERVDSLERSGSAIVPDQPYDQNRYFYFTAVDRSGNESGTSATLTVATEQVVSTDITPGSVGYELLEEGAVRDDILNDDAVRNRHIAAGEITGGKIRAYSIFADRLAIGTTQNLYFDNNYEDPDIYGNRLLLGFHGGSDWITSLGSGPANAPADRRGAKFEVSATTTTDSVHVSLLTGSVDNGVQHTAFGDWPGDENAYSAGDASVVMSSIDLYTANINSGVDLAAENLWHVRYLDGTDAWHSGGAVFTGTNNHVPLEAQFDLDALSKDVAYYIPMWHIYPYMGGSGNALEVGSVIFLTRGRTVATSGSTVIADGAVTTDKVAANAITAGTIAAGAIDAGHISADAIETSQLSADAITSKHTITGAWIRTTSQADRGIHLTSDWFLVYDDNGIQVVTIDANTGDMVAAGTFRSGISGMRAELSASVWQDRPGTLYDVDVTYGNQPVVFGEGSSAAGNFTIGSLVMLSAESTINDSGRTSLILREGFEGFRLGREYGTAERCDIASGSDTIDYNGRFPSGHGASQQIRVGSVIPSSPTTGGSYTYGTPGHSTFYVIISAYDSQGKAMSISARSSSSFSWESTSNTFGYTFYAFRGGDHIS